MSPFAPRKERSFAERKAHLRARGVPSDAAGVFFLGLDVWRKSLKYRDLYHGNPPRPLQPAKIRAFLKEREGGVGKS
jgi:hypothetical protein